MARTRRRFLRNSIAALAAGIPLSPILAAAGDSRVLPGIDVLAQRGFDVLRKKRVGLLTHPAGVNRYGVSSIDVLRKAPRVHLAALFGPEHGIYGDEKANVPVLDKIDPRTGLPVYSLYGKYRRPTREMLDKIDLLVVDLQDVGARSYTYVSAMRYCIEECFLHGKEIVILDRPNPLGGLKVDGPPLEKDWMSYVGAYQVPYVYGLTIGELARMAKDTPGWLEVPPRVARKGKLTVVPMMGWRRDMLWPKTGLSWKPTSPAIPNLSAAMGYSMTGLGCQLGGFVHGYGTRYPFRMLQFSGKKPEQIEAILRAANIQGLDYQIVHFKEDDKEHRGVYVLVKDWAIVRPTELSIYLMRIAAQWNMEAGKGNPFAKATSDQASLFNKHTGSTAFWNALVNQGPSLDVDYWVTTWQKQALAFQQRSQKYWLYK